MRAFLVSVVAFALSVAASSAHANPADLDPTFGGGGTLAVTFAGTESGAAAVVLQPDGKIVAAGFAGDDFGLARANSDGSLDATFGTAGRVTTDFAGASDAATGLALLPDGRLV